MNIQLEDQIGTIVANDYRTAAIFKAKGIDFCCRGHRTLQDAILEKGLRAEDIVNELSQIDSDVIEYQTDYEYWPLDQIIDEIKKKHHQYIRVQIPVITAYLEQINKAHGKTQPVLEEIKNLFAEGSQELLKHMEAEEGIVFPMIRDLISNPVDGSSSGCVPLNFFQQMITSMEKDHEMEGNRWKLIASMTEDYQLKFGCNVAHVTFSLLKEFQDDLHLHIHLENNILFLRAMELKNKKIKSLQS
ncbi:MAG: DUF542 domain-containing protein [Saprospiraceae bacterium]